MLYHCALCFIIFDNISNNTLNEVCIGWNFKSSFKYESLIHISCYSASIFPGIYANRKGVLKLIEWIFHVSHKEVKNLSLLNFKFCSKTFNSFPEFPTQGHILSVGNLLQPIINKNSRFLQKTSWITLYVLMWNFYVNNCFRFFRIIRCSKFG